jgi:hypothetical protein
MPRAKVCDFGKMVKKRLVDIDQTQKWLIDEVSKDTGLYFDDSYLRKILVGVCAPEKIIASICKILQIKWMAQ